MALALTVKLNEDIILGDPKNPIGNIRVTQIRSDGKVVLAFNLPRELEVNRESVAASKASNP